MIIIKTIIQNFIQITHTDDFPSTGTRLVEGKNNWYTSLSRLLGITVSKELTRKKHADNIVKKAEQIM